MHGAMSFPLDGVVGRGLDRLYPGSCFDEIYMLARGF